MKSLLTFEWYTETPEGNEECRHLWNSYIRTDKNRIKFEHFETVERNVLLYILSIKLGQIGMPMNSHSIGAT